MAIVASGTRISPSTKLRTQVECRNKTALAPLQKRPADEALEPEMAAVFSVSLATALRTMVLSEPVMMPLKEQGWP